MVASGNGHTAFMRFLLEEGVDPGIANNSGEEQEGGGRGGEEHHRGQQLWVGSSSIYIEGRHP